MDSNYASAGGGVGVGVGVNGSTALGAVPVGVGANASVRYNAAANGQRNVPYNPYDPYGSSGVAVRTSSAYPYDAEAEFKERTGMGKSKATAHMQMAGNTYSNSVKMQQHHQQPQQHSYNVNSCYGGYNQSTATMTPESGNYYAYAYDQPHHYPQQTQYHQNQLQQQYKSSVSGKIVAQQPHQQQPHHQQQSQQPNIVANTVNAMKVSPPDYGYAPYHHLQHSYYHPHYHHPSQKGAVGMMKTMPDASTIPYVNTKVIHSTQMVGGRGSQYPSNYSYHPHNYPPTVAAGHHTYQSQNVCNDSRWLWNSGACNEYQSSCRSTYPAYVNGSVAKQTNMWPSMSMQYQNTMSTGYPAASAVPNQQSCCSSVPTADSYYPQQYVKHPVQSMSNQIDYNGSNNDLYSNSQANSLLPAATAPAKVYTDLNAQPQSNSYQSMNTSSVSYHQPHQPGNYSASTTLDYNARYLQSQQPDSFTSSASASYYHNQYPYAHQPYTTESQEHYARQQPETKISLTTKSQSLRDFLTSWNEDEDECADRTPSSGDVPFMDQLHMSSEHYAQTQEQQPQQQQPIMENHLQFKGSFTSRPKIHVGITVDSTVESDQYINLPDIIIDIEKSNKDVITLPEDILMANIPKIEKDDDFVKEEKPTEIKHDDHSVPGPNPPKSDIHIDDIDVEKKKPLRSKSLRLKELSQLQKRRLIRRSQKKFKIPRKLLRRVKRKKHSAPKPRSQFDPSPSLPPSLKSLCVSLINSDRFRNRILGLGEIDTMTTDNEVNMDQTPAPPEATIVTDPTEVLDVADVTQSPIVDSSDETSSPSVIIPKLSDLCKNALNSSFDRDVLVINLDEILDSDNLFVVQCDINENILENYVDQEVHDPLDQAEDDPRVIDDTNTNNYATDRLVEILNDNNNNYNSTSANYNISTPATTEMSSGNATTRPGTSKTTTATTTKATAIDEHLKRCCSVSEVSNLPLDNAVEHNNINSNTNRQFVVQHTPIAPLSPCSSSCPAALCIPPSPLIEQNCSTQQITVGHEQLHEMLMLSGTTATLLHDDVDVNYDNGHHSHHHHHPIHDQHDSTISDEHDLLLLSSAVGTPSIHHEEIVPDNLKKFQSEKFLKYLHAKYVQGNLSEFYHANRIIKKYKKRIIKKILNIVR